MRTPSARDIALILAGLFIGGSLLAGCSFDDSALTSRARCAVDDECASGFCVAGYCMDDAIGVGDAGADVTVDGLGEIGLGDGGPVACAPGTTRCDGTDVVRCVEGGDVELVSECANERACSSEHGCRCEESGGEAVCTPNACDPGARFCVDETVRLCAADGSESTVERRCAAGERCIAGACVDRECEPGNARCEGDTVLICSTAGAWVEERDCADVESYCDGDEPAARCVSWNCMPGDARCSTSDRAVVERCDDRGIAFERAETCGEGEVCSDDGSEVTCGDRVCEPGTLRCGEENQRLTCSESGDEWLPAGACSGSESCVDGACVPRICTPGASRCGEAGTVEVCSALGTSWLEGVPCTDDRVCVAGECAEIICEPGATRCRSVRGFETCDEIGVSWVASPACADSAACFEGACWDVICEPGSGRCDGLEVVEFCDELGIRYVPSDCAEGTTCVDGACVEKVCEPSAAFCTAEGDAAICDARGSAVDEVTPCEFGCTDGLCDGPSCGDGVVTSDVGEQCDDGNRAICDGCEFCALERVLAVSPATSSTGGLSWVPDESRLTIEAWVRLDGATGLIAGIGRTTENDHAYLGAREGRLYFRISLGDGNVFSAWTDAALAPGWHHVAGVRTGVRNSLLFVDGQLVATAELDTPYAGIDDTSGHLWIASDGTAAAVAGAIDEVRFTARDVYRRRFTPKRTLGTTPEVLGWFPFDVDAPPVATDAAGVDGDGMTIASASWVADTCYGADASAARCGDGNVAPRFEACDDGNARGGDGCSAACQIECPDGVLGPTGSCYKVFTAAAEWPDAAGACVTWGGHLATIESAAENEWVSAQVGGRNAWIGYNDRASERSFTWISGIRSGYRNFARSEPNNSWPGEDCVQMLASGLWNDLACDTPVAYVCESYP